MLFVPATPAIIIPKAPEIVRPGDPNFVVPSSTFWLGGLAGAAGYAASAVNFDGANDYLSRGAGFTGAADATTGLCSFWFKMTGSSDGSEYFMIDLPGQRVQLRRATDNKLQFNATSSAPVALIAFKTASTFVSSGGWNHCMFAFNMAATTIQCYVNDASDIAITTNTNGSIDYTDTDFFFGADNTPGGRKWTGDLADFYWNPGSFLDLTNAANRAKFISAGKPVNLGPTGAIPTGSAPILFLSGSASTFATNKGTGGGMTTTGTLTNAASSP